MTMSPENEELTLSDVLANLLYALIRTEEVWDREFYSSLPPAAGSS
jgi:hypothetical protein